MESLGLEGLVLLALVFICVSLWLVLHKWPRERANLEAVARKRGARVTDLGLELSFEGARARLTYADGGEGESGWTRLQVDLDQGFPGASRGLVQAIRGEPEAAALDPELRAHLHALQELGRGFFGGPLDVHATAGGIRIEVGCNLVGSRRELARFLDHGLALARAVLCRGGSGPRIDVREVLSAGRCPVCTDAIAEGAERCPHCGTAHHRECFEFLGGCAVLGCDAQRARPQARDQAKGW